MEVGPDVVDVLVEDHRRIRQLLDGVGEEDDEGTLSVGLAELAKHLVVEEEYLYPLVREVLPNGASLAGDGLSHSREAEVLARRLEGSSSPGPDREVLIAELLGVFADHTRATETDLLPELRRTCAPDQLGHLAGVMEMAKRTAPTHAHPGGPHGTPWNQILLPVVGLFDRVRDAVLGRPTKPGPQGPGATGGSRSTPPRR